MGGKGAWKGGTIPKYEKPPRMGATNAGPKAPQGDAWKRVWSEEHQQHYFWNKVTKESSWETPAEAREEAPQVALPAEWEKHYDDERQEWYYWNKRTKESSWTAPGCDEAQPEGDSGIDTAAHKKSPANPAAPGSAATEGAPVLAQTRAKGHITKWQGFCGWITPDTPLGEDFGPQEKLYVNWREMPKGVDLKVGTEVDFLLIADEHGYSAADVQLMESSNSKPEVADTVIPAKGKGKGKGKRGKGKAAKDGSAVDAVARLEKQWSKQDKQLGLETAGRSQKRKAADDDEDENADEGVLLPGWEQIWSAEHNLFYYWHTATKQSSWDRPCMPTDDDDDDTAAGDGAQAKLWEGEGSQQGAAYMATPMTPMQGKPGRTMTPLTPGTTQAPPAGAGAAGRRAPPPAPPRAQARIPPQGGPRRRVA